MLRFVEITKEKPFRAYQQASMNEPPDATTQHLLVPLKITQVRNTEQIFRQLKSEIDHIINLIRISLEHKRILYLAVALDLIMVSITPAMLGQVRVITKLDYETARQRMVLGYDTPAKAPFYQQCQCSMCKRAIFTTNLHGQSSRS